MSARRTRGRDATGDRGAVLPFVAICLTVLVISAALAVDLGRFSVTAREARTVADLAALDSVRELDGSTTADLQVPVEAAAVRSAARNGFVPGVDGDLTVVLGAYDRATRTFRATAAPEVPDAVQVEVVEAHDNQFVPGSFEATRTAVASADSVGLAGIGLATTTAAIDSTRSAVLNALLGDVLGTTIDLTVADWQALANSTITLADLAQIGLGLDPEAVEDLLDRTWSVGQLIDALARIPLGPDATSALGRLVGRGPDVLQLRLADVIQADLTNPGAHLFGLGVADLLQAAAMASGLGRTISLDLDATALGLASATASVQIVEAPQFAIGGAGTTVRSAQVRAQLDTQLLGTLDVAGLAPAAIALPVYVETGRGSATIDAIRCSGGPVAGAVDVSVTTAAASIRVARPVGALGTGFVPATLTTVRTPALPLIPPVDVLRVDADLDLTTFAGTGALVFEPPYGWVPGQQLSAVGVTGSVGDIAPAELDAIVLGALPVPVGTIVGGLVDTALDPALETLVPPLLRALGVDLGIADVSIPFATCRSSALVS